MKKILLATTILGMTAGFAAADVSVSGSASAGIARDADYDHEDSESLAPDDQFHVYNTVTIKFGSKIVTDSGIEFGLSTSISGGNSYSLGDDGFADEGGNLGAAKVTISGAFGKLTFKDDGIDMLYSDGTAGDVSYDYSAGDLSFSIVSDIDGTEGVDSEDANGVDWSASLGYTVSGVALSLATDSTTSSSASVSYTSGAITGTVEMDAPEGDDTVNTLTVAYAANGISAEVSTSSDSTWSASVGYSANAMSVEYSTDDGAAWEATASYDLGGGAKVVGGTNYIQDAYAGVELSF
jgi:outer membrane protein OmpU